MKSIGDKGNDSMQNVVVTKRQIWSKTSQYMGKIKNKHSPRNLGVTYLMVTDMLMPMFVGHMFCATCATLVSFLSTAYHQ